MYANSLKRFLGNLLIGNERATLILQSIDIHAADHYFGYVCILRTVNVTDNH